MTAEHVRAVTADGTDATALMPTLTSVPTTALPTALPPALRQGFSIGQGLAALVITAGAVVLLASSDDLRPLGAALLTAGILALVAVETVRVVRRRRALHSLTLPGRAGRTPPA